MTTPSDDGRTGAMARIGFSNEPDRMVPCRKCGTPTPLSEFAWQLGKAFAKVLMERGEEPLTERELTLCKPCGVLWREWQREQSEKYAEFSTRLFVQAKETGYVDPRVIAELRVRGDHTLASDLEATCKRAQERAAADSQRVRGGRRPSRSER